MPSCELQQPISSNTVFIRKMSPYHRKKESLSTFALPLRVKSKLRISPQPSDIFSRIDNTIFFNHTINFGNKQVREDLQEVLGVSKKSEWKRKTRDKMSMTQTHRPNRSLIKHKNRLSVLNIEFFMNQTARSPTFCL